MTRMNRAFTLVELLVVIAIIGVLVALLLPAVQAAREAGRRSQCLNNLKQLGLAMQNYHGAKNKLPPGNRTAWYGTWQVYVLPYLELQQLSSLYAYHPDEGEFFDSNLEYFDEDLSHNPPVRNRQVIRTRIPTLTCPSDEPQIDVGKEPGRAGTLGTFHNYVANYGNTNHIGRDHLGPANPAYVKYSPGPFLGDDWHVKHSHVVKFKEITDGLSNTMLASETIQGRDGDLHGFTWWGWAAAFEAFAVPNSTEPDYMQNGDSCNMLNVENPPCLAQTAVNIMKAAARSRHVGGVNVAMCDGSVRFVSDSVDLSAWRAAGTIQGEEVFPGFGS
jgi:prepilin-type N-terminal cleavage/methylation domain-containing protein/prepilin-type processing-associated H-X9-DG protein